MHDVFAEGEAAPMMNEVAGVYTHVPGLVPSPVQRPHRAGFRLPLQLKQMGAEENCRHRSGWPHAMRFLHDHLDPDGILLDDFVERSFQHAYCRQEWREPWVGIFHHPPGLPVWLDDTAPIEAIVSTETFRKSLPMLKGAIALSAYLGEWIERHLRVPALVLKHPTEIPERRFSLEAYLDTPRPAIAQVGWYARNTRAIYQLDAPDPFRKLHLLQRRPWVMTAIERIDSMSPYRTRRQCGTVEVIEELDNSAYDELLSRSIIFNEYYTVSASNTIIEAMARGVPLLVNRRPAIEEYLGAGYPLLFDDIAEAPAFLRDRGRIAAAAGWIAELDKSWMDARQFALQVARFVSDC